MAQVLKRVSVGGFLRLSNMGLIIVLIVFCIVGLAVIIFSPDETKIAEYKKGLFSSVGGEQLPAPTEYKDSLQITLQGTEDGFFIRQMYKKGIALEKIVKKEAIARDIIKDHPVAESERRLFELPENIEQLAKSSYWKEVRQRQAVLATLKGILEKGNKVTDSDLETPKVPGARTLLVILSVIQFGGFLSFWVSFLSAREVYSKLYHSWVVWKCRWYDFEWDKFWTYPFLLVFTVPGALPVIALAAVVTLFSPSFWAEVRQKRNAAKSISDLSSFKLEFSGADGDKLLLEKLKKRLKERSNADSV